MLYYLTEYYHNTDFQHIDKNNIKHLLFNACKHGISKIIDNVEYLTDYSDVERTGLKHIFFKINKK